MAVKALAKGVRISPRKVSQVATLIRNRSVNDALVILSHTPRRAAVAVRKVVESARANADYNHRYKPDSLHIVHVTVTPGPALKRFRPVARGMAHPYKHQTSHITVLVDGEKRQTKSTKQQTANQKETK